MGEKIAKVANTFFQPLSYLGQASNRGTPHNLFCNHVKTTINTIKLRYLSKNHQYEINRSVLPRRYESLTRKIQNTTWLSFMRI